MIQDVDADPGDLAPQELRERYEDQLRETIDAVGVGTVADESGVDRETVDALAAGESPELTLEEAAAILAVSPETPDADAIEAEALDELMIGMSIAVLDVDTLESEIDGRIEAKELQQKMEGRFPITLEEYALVHRTIEERKP